MAQAIGRNAVAVLLCIGRWYINTAQVIAYQDHPQAGALTLHTTGAPLKVYAEDRLALLAWLERQDTDLVKIWRAQATTSQAGREE
jgi:hypothetical protein